jgi:acetyl-CoA carboxylase biotin carboxyl carrier protein
VKLDEIKEIVSLLEKSNLNKLTLKKGDFELHLEKEGLTERQYILPSSLSEQKKVEQIPSSNPFLAAPEISNDFFVTSPMVGTFYTTPSPNDPSFVKVGDIVDTGTVICLIEAMKVMNEVKAGVKGKIKEVLCKNAHTVEFGTKLFRIDPL